MRGVVSLRRRPSRAYALGCGSPLTGAARGCFGYRPGTVSIPPKWYSGPGHSRQIELPSGPRRNTRMTNVNGQSALTDVKVDRTTPWPSPQDGPHRPTAQCEWTGGPCRLGGRLPVRPYLYTGWVRIRLILVNPSVARRQFLVCRLYCVIICVETIQYNPIAQPSCVLTTHTLASMRPRLWLQTALRGYI